MKRYTRAATIERAESPTRRWPVTVSTDAPYKRRDYTEILSHAKAAIDLSRAPLPVVESHDTRAVNIGIVTNLKTDGHRLRGELVLGASERAEELAADIEAGIVTGISVGYVIDERQETAPADDLTVLATRWTPYEVSIVSVPADIAAGINRSQEMDEETEIETREPSRAERTRATEILSTVRKAGLEPELAERYIAEGLAIGRVRELVIDELARRDAETEIVPVARSIQATEAPRANFRQAAVDGLLLRAGISVEKPHAAARDTRSMSICDLARAWLSQAGIRHSDCRTASELLKRAMSYAGNSSSDFSGILTSSVHAAIRRGYETEPASHRAWVRVQSVPNFKLQERPILGSAPELLEVKENAEYKEGSLAEDTTSYRVAKYGRIVSLTWEALVNDALDAFLRVKPAMGQAARRLEADTVYDLFALNTNGGPTMQDSVALFHADHSNLASAGALAAATLAAARTLLRRQTALNGGYLSLVPKFLLIPPEQEYTAETLLAAATRHTLTAVEGAETPEWIRNLELVVEPRLADAVGFYLAAAPEQIDTFELGLLEENLAAPTVEEEQGFNVDAMRWKVRHVCGAAALDWRGMVRTPKT